MLRCKIDKAKDEGKSLPYDLTVKMLSALSNITQTIFPDGGNFSEVVAKKKDLLKALDIELPESEMNVVYEEDENAEKAEDYVDD